MEGDQPYFRCHCSEQVRHPFLNVLETAACPDRDMDYHLVHCVVDDWWGGVRCYFGRYFECRSHHGHVVVEVFGVAKMMVQARPPSG